MAVTTPISEWSANGGHIRFFGEALPEKVKHVEWLTDRDSHTAVIQWTNRGDPTVHSFPFNFHFDISSGWDELQALLVAMRLS